MILPGKRYTELDPTTSIANSSLLAVYRQGQPELNRITFEDFQKSIRLINVFDAQGQTLTDRSIFRYSLSQQRFIITNIEENDLPSISITKIIGLQNSLNSKENIFQKGSIVSNTLQIINGVGRLVGPENLEIDFDPSIVGGTPPTRTITINNIAQDLSTNRTWNVGTVTSVATGTGLTGGPITNSGTLSFDISWGDNRYHNRLDLININSTFNFLGNVEGIQVRANTSGSSGFPSELGSMIGIYTPSNNQASAMGRVFAIFKTYNSQDFWLGSTNTAGVTQPWRRIWHSGNFDATSVITQSRNLIGGDGIQAIGNLSEDRTISVDSTVLRTGSGTQTRTGLLIIRRAGTNDGSVLREVFQYDIGDDDIYKMWVMNSQNERTSNGEVNWFFRMREIYGSGGNETAYNFDRIGFHKGGITVLGGRLPSNGIGAEIDTWVNANFANGNPFPISTYILRDQMTEGRGYFGKSNFTDTSFLDADDMLYSEGTVYAKKGLRTADPNNKTTVFDHTTWFLGSATADSTGSHTHKIRVDIDGVLYDIYAETVS